MQGTFLKANYINLFLMTLTNMSLRIGIWPLVTKLHTFSSAWCASSMYMYLLLRYAMQLPGFKHFLFEMSCIRENSM